MKALIQIALLIFFFVAGTLSYDTICLWTLKMITYFTNDKIHFFGKLWDFLGKPEFGMVILLIPVSGYLELRALEQKRTILLFKFCLVYFLFFIISYCMVCYFYAQYLYDLIKQNKIFMETGAIPLGKVNLYIIGLLTIISAGLFSFTFNRFTIKNNPSK